jgi:hypothetical protein
MKCDDAQKLIYLGKEINLDTKENHEFEMHIKTCTKCQNEFASAGQYFSIISHLQNMETPLENPELLTGNVIETIRNFPVKPRSKPGRIIPDFIYFPAFRYAAATILLLIGMFYFYEELATFQKIRGLENKYGFASEKKFNEIKYASVDSVLLNPLKDIYNLVNEEKKYINLPGDWVLVRESEIIRRMQEYKRSSGINIPAGNYKEELKRFFNNPKIQKLMNQDAEIKNLFTRAFPEGVDNHE